MASDTRARLVETAVRLFKRDGFRCVGVEQIFSEVGISRTAFYKHFPSKEDLMLEVLEVQNRWLQDAFRRMLREQGGPSGAGQLGALFDVIGQIIESPEFHGCVFVNAAIEFPLPHEPAHLAAARNRAAVEEIVHEMCERAGAADPQAMAEELCMVMEGVYVTRQVTNRPDTMQIARRLAERVMAAHLPAGGAAENVHAGV